MIRFDRLQRGLYLALTGVALGTSPAAVLWSKTQAPRASVPGDLLALSMLAGPSNDRWPASGVILDAAGAIELTVTGATPGVLSIVRLNGFDYRFESAGGDNPTTIRNELVKQIRDGEAGAVTVDNVGAAGMRLGATRAGGLRSLRILGELEAGDPEPGETVEVKECSTTTLVSLQAFTRGLEPRVSAAALLSRAIDQLRGADAIELLDRYGLAMRDVGGIVDLSAIAGGNWESRASVDLTVAAMSSSVRSLGTVESMSLEVSVGLVPGGPPIETFTVSASA